MMYREGQKSQQKTYCVRSIMNFFQGIVFTVFILTIIVTIYFIIIYHTRLTPFINYAIVFDAGSSHTEMVIYSWPADKSQGLGTTSTVDEMFLCPLTNITTNNTKSGETVVLKAVSDFEKHLRLLKDYFEPCLTKAMSVIPSNRHKFSPIFLGATAGMRLVRLLNVRTSNQILESIREIFSNTPFQFVVARQVRILTDMEEAVDGWITTNILLEKFQHRHKKDGSQPIKSSKELDPYMVGVLDLGGASTQVTFTYTKTINDTPVSGKFKTEITLFDRIYNPYARSYLCWGKNEALRRHRARLLNSAINVNRMSVSNSSPINVNDPCLARGTNDTLKVSRLFQTQCTINEKQKFNTRINQTSFVFVGTGNAAECNLSIINLFDAKRNDQTVNCSHKQEYCTFDHEFQPHIPPEIDLIGLSGYFYVFHNLALGMPNIKLYSSERYDLKDFTEQDIFQRLISVCETPYSRLVGHESIIAANEQHKRNLCFDAWYIWHLLTHGIGFKNNELKRLSFVNKFPTGKVGWTLGYMINQTNYIPAEYREKILTKNSLIGWLTGSLTFALIAFMFLLFTCYTYCISKPTTTTIKNKRIYGQPNDEDLV